MENDCKRRVVKDLGVYLWVLIFGFWVLGFWFLVFGFGFWVQREPWGHAGPGDRRGTESAQRLLHSRETRSNHLVGMRCWGPRFGVLGFWVFVTLK